MGKGKILFISHDANRAGAQIFLLRFLRWFKANSTIPFQILLRDQGELESEFKAVAPTSVFNNKTLYQKRMVKGALTRRGLQSSIGDAYLKHLRKNLLQDNIALVYSNTVTNGEVLEFFSSLKCPVISHVHELEYGIRYYTGLENFERVKEYTQHYIAVSEAVKRNLKENHKISENKIDVIYGFIPTQDRSFPKNHQQVRSRICEQLGISKEALIVCASGTTNWWKGPDLYIELARAVYKRQPENLIYFIWVGGENSEEPWHYEVKNIGLGKYVRFLGAQPNPLDYFAACDVFTLVSREDAFPLAMLEAALIGKPIVCFDGSGGGKEFVEDDAGFVVPYLDVETMATKVMHLLDSPELRKRLGERAKQKVQERHDIEVVAPNILSIIERFLF